MLEKFNNTRVKQLSSFTDKELLMEKEEAERQWNYIQTVKSLSSVTAALMMSKMEWYIGKVLKELFERCIEGGFKYGEIYVKPVKLRLVKKHKKIKKIKGLTLPNI